MLGYLACYFRANMPSSNFMRRDGPYSWIILVTIVVNSFCSLGWLFGSIGVFADTFPELLGIDEAKGSSLGSRIQGICFFTGIYYLCCFSNIGTKFQPF